ncbi:MAG TPA: murein biosynthesis integral membrane protein MurJ [Streptosporangiaceae bacterium]|nr:murein biosynthesis integral membrane protein MurJ [Streptosporangiaceae bacterium]
MTTGVPESDSYPDSGGRGWDVRPAVPGWSAGQDLTGPLFDDTGWHIDLSDVDWGDDSGRDRVDDWADEGNRTFRFEDRDHQHGNGAGPAAAGYDSAALAPPGRTDRRSGRHARHARPEDETRAGPDFRPPGARRPVAGQQPPRTQPRRVVSSGSEAPGSDPQGYASSGYGGAPGYGPPQPYDPPGYQTQGYQAPPYQAPARRPPVYEEPGYDAAGTTQALPYAPDGYGGARPGRPVPPGPPLPGLPAPGTRPPGVRPATPGGPGQRPVAARAPAEGGSASVVRSSGVMAVGTLGSRMTGFLRTLVQNYALGAVGIAEAYNLSNTLPNVVYNLALGGILTSVIVPLIVAASRRDRDRGESYDQRMFTLITLALAGITVVATIAAVPIVYLYKGSQITGHTEHLAVIFAFFFIPQIFFYGVSSLIGAILNSRGSFAAPMWTPIVNNFVVIAVLGLYIAMGGLSKDPRTISGGEVALLGVGTTLGIIVQTAALVPALRQVGFRWQPRLDFRRTEIGEIGRMGGWMFGYIAATQVAFLVTTRVAGDTDNGITVYNYAWLLFQLPYAVVGISVITALLPRMSAHASQRRFGHVRLDFSTGVRLAAAIVVPCSLVLAVLGPKLGEVFFAHGRTDLQQAHYMGVVFAVFCLGLLPYMIFQLQLRVFYSVHDSKTPALIGLATMAVNIVANLIALGALPKSDLVVGLGAGFGVANVVGMVIAWRILSTRLRGLDGYRIGRSLVRMHAAALPAALLAMLVGLVTGNAYIVVIIGGGLAVGMYLLFARALKIEELTGLTGTVLARLGR